MACCCPPSTALLSQAALRHLILRARLGDDDARDRVIEANLYLVQFQAARLASPEGVSRHDLLGYGVLGLHDAMARFDLSRSISFATYAPFWIRSRMQRGIREFANPGALSHRDWESRPKVALATTELAAALSRPPTAVELSARVNLPPAHIALIQMSYLPMDSLSDDDGAPPWEDRLPSHEPTPEQRCLAGHRAALGTATSDAVAALTDGQQALLTAAFGLDGQPARSFKQLAEESGCSCQAVSQRTKLALRDLKRVLRDHPAAQGFDIDWMAPPPGLPPQQRLI